MKLLETIKCENGILSNLQYHQERFDNARKYYFELDDQLLLSELNLIPDEFRTGLYRCRVIYSKTINKVDFFSHEYRKINRLKLVESEDINYKFKYADRKKLIKLFEKRGDFDDILIVKNGSITDSFTANSVFYDGHKWWTPDTPLLAGTQRAKLITEGKIFECKITPNDLSKYKKVGLINAMWDMEKMPVIDISNIQK